MKKLLGTTLALAMFVPAGANAELLKNLKLSGQFDTQTTSARNVRDFVTRQSHDANGVPVGELNNDRIGHAMTRGIVKLDWDLLDDVHSHVTLVYGAAAAGGIGESRVYGAAPRSLNGVQDNTLVQEANVKIDKLMGFADLTTGRQFYGEEGDLIVYYGPRDNYGLTVAAIDMFRADWNGETLGITGIAGKTSDTAINVSNSPAATDTDLRGLVLTLKGETVKPTVYVYNQVRHAIGALGATSHGDQTVPFPPASPASGKNTNLWVIGGKVKINTGGLSAHAEYALNRGQDRTNREYTNFTGWAFLSKVAYKIDLPNNGMITPWGELGYGTGDSNLTYRGNRNFQSINTDYRPGGIYGRFDSLSAIPLGNATTARTGGAVAFNGASNGLSNRIIWGLGVKASPVEKLTVGLAFWRYAFNRLADNANAGPGANATTRHSRNIGSEVDLSADWKHSENVSIKTMVGTFRPGAYVSDLKNAGLVNATRGAAVNPVVMMSGDVSIKF